MVSTNLYNMFFYAGEIQNSNYRRLEMATYFFLTSRLDFARADKAAVDLHSVPPPLKNRQQQNMYRYIFGGFTFLGTVGG